MALNVSSLAKDMVGAAKGSLGKDFPKLKAFVKPEMTKLAQSLVDIAKLAATGEINEQEAKALLRIHRNTTQIVFLTVEGLGIIAVENSINAALKVVRDTVNTATGFALL